MAKPSSGVSSYVYGQRVERQLAKGKSTEAAHKFAASPLWRKKDKFDKPSLADKVILKGLKLAKRLRRKKK